VDKLTNFKILTTKQKKVLEEILSALDIPLDDFLKITNIKDYEIKLKDYEQELLNQRENNIALNNRLAVLEQEVQKLNSIILEQFLGVRTDE
jgi:hypothetical protein